MLALAGCRDEKSPSTCNHLIVRDPEMAIPSEQFFDEEIVKELHVDGCEPDRRVYAVVERVRLFQLREVAAKRLRKFCVSPSNILRKWRFSNSSTSMYIKSQKS